MHTNWSATIGNHLLRASRPHRRCVAEDATAAGGEVASAAPIRCPSVSARHVRPEVPSEPDTTGLGQHMAEGSSKRKSAPTSREAAHSAGHCRGVLEYGHDSRH